MSPFVSHLKFDERRGRVSAARDDLWPVPQGECELASVGLELVPREGRWQLPKVFRRRVCQSQSAPSDSCSLLISALDIKLFDRHQTVWCLEYMVTLVVDYLGRIV